MKKIAIIILTVVLTGCSALPVNLSFIYTPTPAPLEPSDTPGPTVTLIPSATHTPNLFVINTEGPTNTISPLETVAPATRTPSATITSRPTITLEPLDPSLFTPSPNIFLSVQKSTNQIVWGSTCDGARSIQFVIQVQPVLKMKYITLWYRLQDKYSGRATKWGGGAIMMDNDQGKYFYKLELDQIEDYLSFEDAWFQYQFVASTITLKHLGSSVVERRSVSLTHCKVFNP